MKSIYLSLISIVISLTGYNQSTYEITITLPTYSSSNPSHFLISSDSDWDSINSNTKSIFFVQPGDYKNAGHPSYDKKILITKSGTSTNKRYIILHNGNNLHPGKLNQSQLAKVGFHFQNADHWIIDRMSYWNKSDGFIAMVLKNASHNIINRYFLDNVAGGAVFIYPGSNNNTIQNCRVQRSNISLFLDRPAFGLSNGTSDSISIKNTHVVNNEVYNFVDGFQAIKTGAANQKSINYEGTIIDYNHFFIDSTIYTNCLGTPNVNGKCAYAENAIDLKSGSENASNPMVISNNKMWGYRKSDGTGSYLSDPGAALVAHFNVNNTIIENNVLFNSTRGIAVGGPRNGSAFRNSKIKNNIIYQILGSSLVIYDSHNVEISSNLNKESGVDISTLAFSYRDVFHQDSGFVFTKNMVVNTKDTRGGRNSSSTISSSFNEYYQSVVGQISDVTDTIHITDPTSSYMDLVFVTNRYTNNPDTITIPKVLKPPLSYLKEMKNKNNSLKVYPNPAFESLVLEGEIEVNNVKIFNLVGEEVTGLVTIYSISNSKLNIGINNLKPGVYFVKLNKIGVKFIKK